MRLIRTTNLLLKQSMAFILFLGIFCTGCDKESPPTNVSTTVLNFPYTGGEQQFSIASNSNWNISSDGGRYGGITWLTFSPESGTKNGVVTVKANANDDYRFERTASILVSATDLLTEHTVSVTVAKYPTWLNLTFRAADLLFEQAGATRTFLLETNMKWEIYALKIPPDFSVSPMSGSNNGIITITAFPNPYFRILQTEYEVYGQYIAGTDTINIKRTFRLTQGGR